MKKLLPLLCIFCFNVCAQTIPMPLAKDSRIKQVMYDAEDVVNITGVDLITTSIEFDELETILDVVVGDSGAWQLDKAQGRSYLLYLKPLRGDSDTNMQVVTNKRIYEFRITSGDFKPQDITYRLKFNYPEVISEEIVQEEEFVPAFTNYHYSFSGNSRVAPVEAFDDGSFTYFKFKGKQLPAIFAVNANRKEELVNYRLEADYVVIERISGQFTIRDHDLVATIVNHHFMQEVAHG